MKVLLIDNGTTLLEKLKVLIPGGEIIAKFDTLDAVSVDDFDLTILSGSSVYPLLGNEGKFSKELSFIRSTKKPLVGICFGFELIVMAFGGKLKKLESKDKGIREIEILDATLCEKTKVNVYENHTYGAEKLPEDFSILAKSVIGPEIIKHKMLPVYGFQFHPENFTDELEGDEIFLQLFSRLQ